MLKHGLQIIALISIIMVCMFRPYFQGDYDGFATPLSSIVQFASFASLLLVPVALPWLFFEALKLRRNAADRISFFGTASLWIGGIVVLMASLGALATNNSSLAIIMLPIGFYFLYRLRQRMKQWKEHNTQNLNPTPYYLIIIPLAVFAIRLSFLVSVKENSTAFIIRQSESLIQDIEAYKKKNGYYPVSLQSTIEDYKPSIACVNRFHYELNGNTYNIYFEQFSELPGTQEIIMFNKAGEHEMTVHNQDLLRIESQNILRGYHESGKLPYPDWEYFLFD